MLIAKNPIGIIDDNIPIALKPDIYWQNIENDHEIATHEHGNIVLWSIH